jgi:hypothetical protein
LRDHRETFESLMARSGQYKLKRISYDEVVAPQIARAKAPLNYVANINAPLPSLSSVVNLSKRDPLRIPLHPSYNQPHLPSSMSPEMPLYKVNEVHSYHKELQKQTKNKERTTNNNKQIVPQRLQRSSYFFTGTISHLL